MVVDPRINETDVLQVIYEDSARTIWSPCTTLKAMEIEQYPHIPKNNRLAMKRVLETLHLQGLLLKRSEPHSYFTFKETVYERAPGVNFE